jgi:L-amino acid N-acyltransferase YncA
MLIRRATIDDWPAIWRIFATIVATGDTYSFATDTSEAEAHRLWIEMPAATYVAEIGSGVVGTYYLKPNQPGGGSHVANCGYMVSSQARGQGIAAAMCEHSQVEALHLGFKAMQFNFVVSSNQGAVRLWQRLGYEIVGTVPKAFDHKTLGYVDVYVMYKWLKT